MPLVVSIDNMVAEIRRELGFRGRVYPRWVQQGKLRAEMSAMHIERLEAVLEALEELRLARAFQEAVLKSMLPAEFLCDRDPKVDGVSVAWLKWCAPREAPLTTGTHAKAQQ